MVPKIPNPDITRLDPNDMPDHPKKGDRGAPRPEFDAVRALKEGEAIKFRCSWKHHSDYQCGSFVSIARIFNKGDYGTIDKLRAIYRGAPWKGRWVCKDGWVYVNRVCTHLEKLGFGATEVRWQ